MPGRAGVLECVDCRERYDLEDIGTRYILAELHCVKCYVQRLLDDGDCFGGWHPEDIGCRTFCADRKNCKMFSLGLGMIPKQIRVETKRLLLKRLALAKLYRSQRYNPENPFTRGSIRRALFDMACKKTTRDNLKQFCDRIGTSYVVQMKVIKRGFGNGHIWDYHETNDGQIWIDFTPHTVLQRNKEVRRAQRSRTDH